MQMVTGVCHAMKCNAQITSLGTLCGPLELEATVKVHQLSGVPELCFVPECYTARRATAGVSLLPWDAYSEQFKVILASEVMCRQPCL